MTLLCKTLRCWCLASWALIAMAANPVQLPNTQQFELHSRHTGKTYRLFISEPPAPAPAGGWPVLYALDGNLWFPLLHMAAPRQPPSQAGRPSRPAGLIVAIGYPGEQAIDEVARSEDYTPPFHCQDCLPSADKQGGADAFFAFIEEELKPAIAARWTIDPTRQTLLGYSYGGLFSLYVMLKHSQAFSRYMAVSPSIWYAGHALLDMQATHLDNRPHGPDSLLLVGSHEQYPPQSTPPARAEHLRKRRMLDNAKSFSERLQSANWPSTLQIIADEDHGSIIFTGAFRAVNFAFSKSQ